MATDAQEVTDRALRSSRRNRACRRVAIGAAAMSGHAVGHANTAAVGIAGSMFVAATGLTWLADKTGAPEQIVWIWAALAGTMAGAFAGVMASMILQPRATVKRHLAYLLLAFVFGMIGAPLVAMWWEPVPPKHIPIAFVWFSMSGIGGFLAPALAIALSKRSDEVANDVIDKFSTPKQARDQRRTDNDQAGRVRLVPLVLLAGLAVLAWFCRDILFLLYVIATGGFGH